MKTVSEIKFRGYHIDHFNHVNNARYLEFLEEGRWHYLDENGLIDTFHERGITHVTVNININYRRSAMVGQILKIETRVVGKTNKSFTMGTTLTETLKNRKDRPVPTRTAGEGKRMAAIKLTYWLGIGADALWAVGLLIPQV